MPASHPVAATPMAFARVIASAFRRRGQSAERALSLAQITPAQLALAQAHITARQMELLSGTAMQALDDEALGAFSRRLPWGSYGMLARASLSSPNLGVALMRWCRHHALIANDLALRVTVEGDTAALTIQEGPTHAALPAERREFSLVHLLRNVHGLACWYVDSRIPLQGAAFPYAGPAHQATYAHMFPGPLLFGQPRAALRFDARYLALALRRDEDALRQMLARALPLTVLQYRRDRLLVQQVRTAMLAHPEATHTADALACALNLSQRTLHRQLKEEGSSLQALKDQVRSERARDLLYRTDRPIKQIAAAVGFRNEKSFIRAFRSWTGQTPADFRAQQAR